MAEGSSRENPAVVGVFGVLSSAVCGLTVPPAGA